MATPKKEDAERFYWESRILDARDRIPIRPPARGWLYSTELQDYIKSWYDLKRFLERHGDTWIRAEIVTTFIELARLLRKVAYDLEEVAYDFEEETIRERASDRLGALESVVEQVLWEVTDNWYHVYDPTLGKKRWPGPDTSE